jgi:hypothetical protein
VIALLLVAIPMLFILDWAVASIDAKKGKGKPHGDSDLPHEKLLDA